MKEYVQLYKSKAAQLTQTINAKYWDEGRGLYADTKEKNLFSHGQSLLKYQRQCSFLPCYSHILGHIMNPFVSGASCLGLLLSLTLRFSEPLSGDFPHVQ